AAEEKAAKEVFIRFLRAHLTEQEWADYRKVITEIVAPTSATQYQLTAQALDELRRARVPDKIIAKLRPVVALDLTLPVQARDEKQAKTAFLGLLLKPLSPQERAAKAKDSEKTTEEVIRGVVTPEPISPILRVLLV